MIQIIAWIGAVAGLLGGCIMLFAPAPPELRSRMRRQGIISLVVGALGLGLALGMARGVL
jgi:NADH:ubiquinone oxidoreductase subunit 6 (subunit J)